MCFALQINKWYNDWTLKNIVGDEMTQFPQTQLNRFFQTKTLGWRRSRVFVVHGKEFKEVHRKHE